MMESSAMILVYYLILSKFKLVTRGHGVNMASRGNLVLNEENKA